MKRVVIFFLISLAVILQLSLLPALRPFGVVPNLVLVMMVLIALNTATSEALVAAVVAGVVIDLVGSVGFGLWTGVLMLVTLVAGLMHRAGVELHGVLVAVVMVAVGTLVTTFAVWSTLVTGGLGWPVSASFGGRLAIELVINLGLTVMMRPLAQWALAASGTTEESGV